MVRGGAATRAWRAMQANQHILTCDRRKLKFGKHGVKIQNKKKIVERTFDILILSGGIEPGKSSCLQVIASYAQK